jgi:WXG100 family type VII secretion target
MTGGGFAIDPQRLTTEAAGFETQSQALETVHRTLRSSLDAEGACWGGDDTGQQFASQYLPGVDQAMQGFTALIGALSAITQQLDAGAQTHAGNDQAYAEGYGQAAGRLVKD